MTSETRGHDIILRASLRGLRDENAGRLIKCQRSLAALKNQTSVYATEHRLMIALYQGIAAVIDDHIEACGVVLSAPAA